MSESDRITGPASGEILTSAFEKNRARLKRMAESQNLPHQIGDYRIIGQIGRGGMGVVYEAEQESLGRRVALKVLPTTQLDSASAKLRFQREARSAARMHHTNIVPVFEVGQDGDFFFYAMQLISGRGLDEIIDELKLSSSSSGGSSPISAADRAELSENQLAISRITVTPSQVSSDSGTDLSQSAGSGSGRGARKTYFQSAARVALQTADALAFAHDRGVIHRDIKPSNLLMDVHGVTWVTDFGLAKVLEDDNSLTRSGDYLGTLRYMSPERFQGKCDERADVYALGLTLYELLLLRPAFDAGDRIKLIYLINNTEPPRPRSIAPDIPRDLETIVLKCIEKEPDARYNSAAALHEDLQRFLNDEPILARRLSGFEQLMRWVRSNPGLAASLAGIATLLLVLSIGGVTTAFYQAELRSSEAGARSYAEQALKQAEFARDDANKARDLARDEQRKAEEAESTAELAAQSAEESARKESEAREAAEAAHRQLQRTLYLSEARAALSARDEPDGSRRIREVVDRWQDNSAVGSERGWEWELLQACARPDGLTIAESGATCLSWSPDDQVLAAGMRSELRLFHSETGMEITDAVEHPAVISGVAWSPDGRRIVTSCEDRTIRIWDAQSGEELKTIGPFGHPVRRVRWAHAGSRIAISSDNVGIFVVDTDHENPEPILITDFQRKCLHLEWSPDDSRLVDGVWYNHHMTVYHVEDRDVERHFPRATRVIWKDGHEIDGILHAVGSGQIDLYNSSGDSREQIYRKHGTWPVALDVHEPSGTFVSVAEDKTAVVWDIASGQPKRTYVEHTRLLTNVRFSNDGHKVASVDSESICVWDVRDPVRIPLNNATHDPGVRQHRVTGISWHPNGQQLATSAYDGKTQVWDLETLTARRIYNDVNYSVAYHPSGTHIATGTSTHLGVIVDASDQTTTQTFSGGQNVYWNADGSRLGSIGVVQGRHTAQVFDFPAMKPLFSQHASPHAMSFHPTNGSFCFITPEQNIVLCAPDGELRAFSGFRGLANALAWSPDGAKLAAACADNTIRIWESTDDPPFELKGHRDRVSGLSWHPDGVRLASASDDGSVRLWNSESRREVLSLADSVSGASCLAFSPDGQRLAVGREDGLVTVWGTDRSEKSNSEGSPALTEPAAVAVATRPVVLFRDPAAERLISDDWTWSKPKRLPINTEFEEYEPFPAVDGLSLYFHSDRPGGQGDSDLWMTRRASLTSDWQPAENVGTVVNSSHRDESPCLAPDGLSLYFSSNRAEGNLDIWMCVRESAEAAWSVPVKLPEPVNSIHADIEPSLSADGKTLVFVSTRGGQFDLWMARRDGPTSAWKNLQRMGGDVNSSSWQGSPTLLGEDFGSVLMIHSFDYTKIACRKSPDDPFLWAEPLGVEQDLGLLYSPGQRQKGDTIYFRRPDAEHGTFDLWSSQRVKRTSAE